MNWRRLWRPGLVGPVLALLVSLWLLYHLLTSELYRFAGIQSEYGPLSWPTYALVLLALAIGYLCVSRSIAVLRSALPDRDPSDPEKDFDNIRVAIGGWMIVLYGIAIVFLGFLISSVLFLAIWMLFGRMRNPLTIAAISILGTVAPLYLLVKVAYLPLPRGVGPFNAATLWLYELLGIF